MVQLFSMFLYHRAAAAFTFKSFLLLDFPQAGVAASNDGKIALVVEDVHNP